MEIITKTVWKTDDGAEFDTKENALLYENELYKKRYKRSKAENYELRCKISLLEKVEVNKKDLLNTIPEATGIYMLTNPYDNYKKYIGSAVNLRNRYQAFLNEKRDYSGKKINSARITTKPHLWTHTILELCEPNELEEKENHYINAFNSIEQGYNNKPATRIECDKTHKLISNEDKKLKNKIRNSYETFKTAFHFDLVITGRKQQGHSLGKGDDVVTFDKYKQQYDVDEYELWEKKQHAIELNNGNKVSMNYRLLTLDKNLKEHVITINDIIYLPTNLNAVMSKRQKFQNNGGLKAGVIYNKCEKNYTVHLYSSTDKIDEYVRNFETENDAFNFFIDFKRKQIQKYTEKCKDVLDEHIYELIMSLTNEDVEKLICY